MDIEEMNKKMGKIIARAWSDAEFKARLLANPAETLQAEGIEVPAGVKVNAVENTDEQFFLVIPKAPDELSDEQLDHVAGGFMCSGFVSGGCCHNSSLRGSAEIKKHNTHRHSHKIDTPEK